jgi:hypothetical protein
MGLFTKRHSRLTGDDLHGIVWKEVADSAARLALVVTEDKEGRIVKQQSDGSFWVLDDYTGPTWRELTSVGVAAVTSVFGEVGDVTLADANLVMADITDLDLTGLADDYIIKYDLASATWKVEVDAGGGGGVTDHGALTGLGDDDHSQYHNDTRGDARYYTQSQVDTSLARKADTANTHTLADVTDSGTAAQLDVGTTIGTVIQLEDVGGNAGLPIVDGTQLTGISSDVQTEIDTKVDATSFNNHSVRHENGGADEISVAGLSGTLADPQTPSAHASSHQNGGGDEISVAGLSGLLADEQYSAIQDGGVPETDEGGLAHTLNFGSNLSVTGISSGVVTVTSVGGSDATAIHTDANNEISGVTEKASPVGADIVVIEDSAATYVKKKVQLSNLPGGISLEDEGVAVTGTPHSTLNFVGDTVTATNVDGSEATITVASFGTSAGTISEGDHDHAGVYSPAAHTHDDLANVAQDRILGRVSAGSGVSEELTAAQVRTLINVEDNATAAGATGDAYATSHEADTSAHNAGEITNDSLVAGIYVDDALNTLLSDKAEASTLTSHTSSATIHFTEASIDHTAIANIGSNSHTQIDDHINLVDEHRDWTSDQGASNINSYNLIAFTDVAPGAAPASGGGTVNFLRADGTWQVPSIGGASNVVQNAQKASAGTITAGQVVRITGYDLGASVAEVELADSSAAATMPGYGVASSSIEQAVTGTVVLSGELTGIDTSSYSEGDALYVSETAGALTATKPQGTAEVQQIATVVRSHLSAGIIRVLGVGRSNDLPNIPQDQIWVGDSNGVPETRAFNLLNLGAGTLAQLNNTVADATMQSMNAGEISALTEKASPVSADLLIIEDSAAGDAKKKLQFGSIDHNALTNYVANEHIDWEAATAGTIHSSNLPTSTATVRARAESATTGAITANTLIEGPSGSGSPNTTADLLDYDGLTFEDDVEIYINGRLMRGGADAAANNDVYPAALQADREAGAFHCEFDLQSGDVIQMFYGGGAIGVVDSVTAGNGITDTGTGADPVLKLEEMPANTIKGNSTGSQADPANLSTTTVSGMLDHDLLVNHEADQHRVILQGLAASRPAAGTSGRYYHSTDTNAYEYDNGASWDAISLPVDDSTIGVVSNEIALKTTGTPDNTKFLRDDMQWTAIAAGGDVSSTGTTSVAGEIPTYSDTGQKTLGRGGLITTSNTTGTRTHGSNACLTGGVISVGGTISTNDSSVGNICIGGVQQVLGTSSLTATGGSFLIGFASSANASGTSTMQSSGIGSFAVGTTAAATAETSTITASGQGSFAGGNGDGNDTLASNTGSFAWGDNSGGDITASQVNSVQFGPGVNAQAGSLQVGDTTDGIRLTAGGSAPSSPHNGDIWVESTKMRVRDGGVSTNMVSTHTESITVQSPSASENRGMFYTTVPITVTQITAVIVGSTSVDFNISHGTSRAAVTNDVMSADDTADSTTTGNITTSFGGGDPTIPANSFVALTTSALSGTPTELLVTVEYTED